MRQEIRKARFVVAHRLSKITVSADPHLDGESLRYFESSIETVSEYLEYGSGGSTVFAHKHVDCLVSVESDRRFLRAVEKALATSGPGAETILIPVNLGLTEAWGKPVFTKPTGWRVRRWRGYPKAPWDVYKARNSQPDLILVDGRFRVACVLESLLNQTEEAACPILLDDYADRPWYSTVEQFADLLEMKGRMAVLQRKRQMDAEQCKFALETFYSDFR